MSYVGVSELGPCLEVPGALVPWGLQDFPCSGGLRWASHRASPWATSINAGSQMPAHVAGRDIQLPPTPHLEVECVATFSPSEVGSPG